jgi:hypothetical protein
MAAELHRWLAIASAFLVLLVGLEAGWRAARRSPPGPLAARLEGLLLLAIGVAATGGLGILAGGGSPHELLHFVYAGGAFGILPVLGRAMSGWEPRRRGLATLLAAVVTLVAILRLAATG